jgi:hypothetical protein
MPEVNPEWMNLVAANFIAPTVGDGFVATPVATPAQFWPFTGLDSLTLDASTRLGSAILDARAIRPNGGLFSRFPSLGAVTWTPVLSAPTDTPFRTYDIARQYDPFADFPDDPSNVLAVVNAAFGLINHDYSTVTVNPDDPHYDPTTVVQQYGDTTYYLIPSNLPLLEPLRRSGQGTVADALEPVLAPIVESGYDRTTPYGQHTPASTPATAVKAAEPPVENGPPAARTIRRPAATVAPGSSATTGSAHRTEQVKRSRR